MTAQEDLASDEDEACVAIDTSLASGNKPWQSSLSNMSNKFSLFGGGGAMNTNKRKSAASKQAPASRPHNGDVDKRAVALDGWIETKVVSCFDDYTRACGAQWPLPGFVGLFFATAARRS